MNQLHEDSCLSRLTCILAFPWGECPIKKGSVHVTFVTLQFYIFTEVKLNVKMVALSHTEDESDFFEPVYTIERDLLLRKVLELLLIRSNPPTHVSCNFIVLDHPLGIRWSMHASKLSNLTQIDSPFGRLAPFSHTFPPLFPTGITICTQLTSSAGTQHTPLVSPKSPLNKLLIKRKHKNLIFEPSGRRGDSRQLGGQLGG